MSGGIIETIEIIEPWLYETLSSDSTLAGLVGDRIDGTLSSETPNLPSVIFLLQSPLDVIGIGGTRISTENLYVVKAVAQTTTWDDLLPVAKRIDQLLHRPSAVMTGPVGSLSCIREREFHQVEINESISYYHLGGIYRIRASADD